MTVSSRAGIHIRTYVMAGILCLASVLSHARELSEPYAVSNGNPFVQVYGLPVARSAHVLAPSSLDVAVQFEASNSFTFDSEDSEAIFIDGETHRFNLSFRYGLNDKIELVFDLPYVSHEAGGLDGFIDDWHDAFGLPDGDRKDFASDQLQYRYSKDGQTLVNVNGSDSGIGDVSLGAAYQLQTNADRQWAVRTGIKLPTGDADSLFGSESVDVYAGLHVSDQSAYKLHWHASGGAMWMSSGEVIDSERNDWVTYGSATLSYQWSDALSLKAQMDMHSAFYESKTKELGSASAQLILGGAIRLSESMLLDFSVSEDIVVDTAPDVVFQLGLNISM